MGQGGGPGSGSVGSTTVGTSRPRVSRRKTSSSRSIASLLIARLLVLEVDKPRAPIQEEERHDAGRAVPVLRDVQVRDPLPLAVPVVRVLTVDEQHHVRILLDTARIAKVREHGD